MKLHLPKMLAAALIAASTALIAGQQTMAAAPQTIGQTLTWDGGNADAAHGKYVKTTFDDQGGVTYGTTYQGWNQQGMQQFFYNQTNRNTLRFGSDKGASNKSIEYTFNNFTVGGFFVDSGAEGFDIHTKNDTDRSFYLGTTVSGATGYSTIKENFLLKQTSANGNSIIHLQGNQVFDVESGNVFTIQQSNSNTLDFDTQLVVKGGGTVAFDGTSTVVMTDASSLEIQNGSTVTFGANVIGLSHTIQNAGTVTFGGTVTLSSSLAGFEATGSYVDYKDEAATDGYAGALTYTIVKGGSFTLPAQVTWNGQTKDVVDGTVTIGDSVDKTTYHLVTSGSNLNLADELSHNDQLNKVTMATGTTLNADADFAGTVSGTGTAAVTIASGKVLSGTVTGVTLSGEGTYALATNTVALGNGVTLGEGWAGTVRITDASANSLDFSSLVHGGSTLELKGFSGYPTNWYEEVGNITENIKLTDGSNGYALKYTGSTRNLNHAAVFTGKLSGEGTLQTAGNQLGFTFTGNIEDWTGKIQVLSGAPILTFGGSATKVNAAIDRNGNTVNLVVDSDATFSKAVNVSGATLNGTATFMADTTLGGLTCAGTLVVDAGDKTVSVSGNANTLGHAIELKSGTLNLSGTYDVTALHVAGTETIVGGTGIAEGSGFIHSEGNITVVDKTSGTLNIADGTVFTHTAGNLQVSQDTGIATIASTNFSTLWVKSVGDVSYTAAQTIASEVSVGTVHLDVQDGVITMDQADAAVALVISEGVSGTVKATAATTLNSVTGLGEGQTLTITGTAPVTLGSTVTGDKIVVDNGKIDLGAFAHTLASLEITNGSTAVVTGLDSDRGCVSGTISIGAGSVFTVNGHHDAFGYHEATATQKIVMGGSDSDHKAVLELNPTIQNAGTVTMTTDIEMNGYAAITSTVKGFNTYDCTITATGVENTIDQMYLRNDVTITVEGADSELAIGKLQRTSQFSGTITKEGEGTLVFDGTENYLDKAIAVNGGTLALDGTFSIGAIAGTENASYAGGAVADNGFKTSSTTRTVYTKGDGADVTVGKDAHFMVGEEEVTLLDNGTATTAATTDYTAFYVRHESEKVSKAFEEQHQPTSFHLSENTELVVDQDVTAAVRGAGASSKVTIELDQTLAGTAQNVTLAGSGTYALDNATVALGTGVALDGEWAGIVSVSGVTFNGNFGTVCGNLANDDSWIELKGTQGYLNNAGNKTFTYDTNLILSRGEDGWAYAQNNGNNNSVLVFTGTIVGDGNLGRSEGKGSTYTYEFTGDISGWNGQFISRNLDKNSTTFKLSGEHEGDMEVRATLVNKGTDFRVAVDTDATFNADVEATKVTVADGKTATFLGDTTIGTIEGPGKVVVGGGTTLTVTDSAEGVQIEAKDGATIAGEGIDAAQVGIAAEGGIATFADGIAQESGIAFSEGAVVTNNGGEAAAYNTDLDTMTVKADALYYIYGGEDTVEIANKVVVDEIVNVSGSQLTLKNAESMELKTMTISGTSTVEMLYTDDQSALVEGTVTITESLVAGGGKLLANLNLVHGSTLDLSGAGENALTLGSNLAFVDGAIVNLDATTLAKLDALVMGSPDNYLELIHAAQDTTLTYGEDSQGIYNGMWFGQLFDRTAGEYTLQGDFKVVATGESFGLTKVSNVPEPTTGTLSLLALAALAARRRKH